MEHHGKTITLASDPFPPYQYFLESGELAGMDYALVSEVARQSGYTPNILLDDWGKVNEMIRAKEIDAIFQIAPTPQRLANFHFSDPYRYAVTELVTADETLQLLSYSQLLASGLHVGMIRGYVYGDAFDNLPEEIKVEFHSAEEELLAVSRGEVPLAVFDQGVRLFLSPQLEIQNLHEEKAFSFERPMFVMFYDKTVRDDFNRALGPYLARQGNGRMVPWPRAYAAGQKN